MFSFALQVLLVIFVIGGTIAYIGNYVGRYIGRRRLTIFGLRPRHTAATITVLSGILIGVSTLFILLLFSQDARSALLGLENLKGEIRLRTKELEDSNRELGKNRREQQAATIRLTAARQEIRQLEKLKKELGAEVRAAREGKLLFQKGETISISLVQGGPEKDKLRQGLAQIIREGERSLQELGLSGGRNFIFVEKAREEEALNLLMLERQVYVVRLVADRNVVFGEEIPAGFELTPNRRIYRKGEKIAELDIPSGLSVAAVEGEILRLLSNAHLASRQAGVVADPGGVVGSVPYAEIHDLARKIRNNSKRVNLAAVAAEEIYAVGPLEVDFKISYK